MSQQQQKHIVLIHGGCHGAWCWFKLKPLLEAAGHRITTLDMTAAGINLTEIHQVHTLSDYTKPLLDFLAALPTGEKVVLVGHSQGGINLASAMENYPGKISLSIFLSAFMPDTLHAPSYIFDQYLMMTPPGGWKDTVFVPYDSQTDVGQLVLFGPEFLGTNLYQHSSIEDLELARSLVRTTTLLTRDLAESPPFSEQAYGSVKRVYITSDDDLVFPRNFQLFVIQNSPVLEVKDLTGVDHMSMLSDPHQLSTFILDYVARYA